MAKEKFDPTNTIPFGMYEGQQYGNLADEYVSFLLQTQQPQCEFVRRLLMPNQPTGCIGFGKHKDTPYNKLDDAYVRYCVENHWYDLGLCREYIYRGLHL